MAVLLSSLAPLVDTLRGRGYVVVGPTVRDGAIVLATAHDSPRVEPGSGPPQS